MNITIIGTGYVGLVTGVCLAEMGHHVCCHDIDEEKISALAAGQPPIYERGLSELLKKNIHNQKLSFNKDIGEALRNCDICFICVGTPPDENGKPNLSALFSAVHDITDNLEHQCIIAIKSTVPVGTCERVCQTMNNALSQQGKSFHIDVVSNPEFLKEGVAIEDFMRPDRIIVGVEKQSSLKIMRSLYRDFIRNGHAFLSMSLHSAEMTKYAANAMLATRISFINEIARLCEYTGADIRDVRSGIGSDKRIGMSFLYPGLGYGGSCFPKDVQALISLGKEMDDPPQILNAAHAVNENQWLRFAKKISEHVKNFSNPTVSVWGLAFKPNTDDIREAPALKIIEHLLQQKITVKAYDPLAITNAKHALPDNSHLSFSPSALEATQGADALVIATEWGEFRNPDFSKLKDGMRHQVLFDGRNLFEPDEVHAQGFEYHWIGQHRGKNV